MVLDLIVNAGSSSAGLLEHNLVCGAVGSIAGGGLAAIATFFAVWISSEADRKNRKYDNIYKRYQEKLEKTFVLIEELIQGYIWSVCYNVHVSKESVHILIEKLQEFDTTVGSLLLHIKEKDKKFRPIINDIQDKINSYVIFLECIESYIEDIELERHFGNIKVDEHGHINDPDEIITEIGYSTNEYKFDVEKFVLYEKKQKYGGRLNFVKIENRIIVFVQELLEDLETLKNVIQSEFEID